ncbi:MAG: hypothetical protein KBT01_05705 [Clostridiales bacterium]|nr:hypothetical protein [Candidatus Blautia equi]
MAFQLNKKNYFEDHGVNIMVFDDIYPAGHQSGVSILMHGKRVATNGDVRFEQTPGQWQPVPKQQNRVVDHEKNQITTTLSYPDMQAHLHGFNPIIYPDFEFNYDVIVTGSGDVIDIVVNLDRPIAPEFAGKLCFNLELFPGELFGKPWMMDDRSGIFPVQPNGPTKIQSGNYAHTGKMKPISDAKADRERLAGYNKGYSPIRADDLVSLPYACGHSFTVRPDDALSRFTVKSEDAELKLYDGRLNHNNGWFVLSSEIPQNKTKNAIHWTIRPNVDESWCYAPVVQVSQIGYHPDQPKKAVVELDARDESRSKVMLKKLTTEGYQDVKELPSTEWGNFLRYNYLVCDFSDVTEEGIYIVTYGDHISGNFRISKDVYDRGVWQPVLEYFLPVQMCHMRVNEKYRVWHGHCHHDDARMAPSDYEQFDGAAQCADNMTKYNAGDHIEGLNAGGWHDAGDFDLRIESQTGEMYKLAAAFEEFDAYVDETTIDQQNHIVEIHQPDGKNDVLQQVEHGALSVVGGY